MGWLALGAGPYHYYRHYQDHQHFFMKFRGVYTIEWGTDKRKLLAKYFSFFIRFFKKQLNPENA